MRERTYHSSAVSEQHNTASAERRAGFTMVEIIIVIGIIVVLISILLPALGKARDIAQTTACMSNLRQIGQAMVMYASENNGYILPAAYRDASKNTLDNWGTILVVKGYLQAPRANSQFAQPVNDPSVFRCPAGLDQFGVASPISQTDANGAGPFRSVGVLDPKLFMDIWYGINGESASLGGGFDPGGPGSFTGAPCRRLPEDSDIAMTVNNLVKLTRLRYTSDTVFLFDGWFMNIWGKCARINARHGRATTTNLLLFDGHVETAKTNTLPQRGTAEGGSDISNLATLNANFPYPKWRLEQN